MAILTHIYRYVKRDVQSISVGNELVHAGRHARPQAMDIEECPRKGVALNDGTCT